MTVGIPFGNYRLVRRLARGGMAEVFLALQSGLEGFERTVAVKRILPHLADSPQFVEMFMDEARLAAQLSHPNIAHIYEFGKVDDSYFIAMEYIDGIDLSAVVLDGLKQPLPVEHAARVIADVCAALHYAHSLSGKDGKPFNLVHRDISPQNILVSFSGSVKMVDFGIAKAAIHIERTRPGVVRGKYTYMSPEQVEGKPLDGRTDLFCAGIVLYELCTADALFPRNDPIQAMRRIRACEIPKPTRAGTPLPPKLEEILMRALAKRREDRYRNAAEMQMDLEEYLRSAAIISNSIVLGEYFTSHYRRFRPTPEQVRSSAEVRDRTAGLSKAAPGGKGTALVGAARPLAVSMGGIAALRDLPVSDEDETLIMDDPSSSQPQPVELLDAPPLPPEDESLHRVDTLIKSSSVADLSQYATLAPSQTLPDRPPRPNEPRTLAYAGRGPISMKSTGPAVGGEIFVDTDTSPPRLATPPGVTIDPGMVNLSTIIEPPDDEDTKTIPPERVRPPMVVGTTTMPLQKLGRRALVVGLVIVVAIAGILTGHWLSAVPGDGGGASAEHVARTVEAGPPLDRSSPVATSTLEGGAPATTQATLRILSEPEGASVIIDGAEVPGTTPISHPLEAGSHSVVASYPGFEDRTQKVLLDPAQELTVKLTLRRLPSEQVVSLKRQGSVTKKRIKRPTPKVIKATKKQKDAAPAQEGLLTLTTIPWATVYLGNRKIGITPFANVTVPAGTYTLRLVDERGRSFSKQVTVSPQRVSKLRFKLPDG